MKVDYIRLFEYIDAKLMEVVMPIYEYECPCCREKFEKLQRRAEEQPACPRCGKPAQRSVSVFAGATATAGGGCAGPAGSGFG